LIKDLIVKKLFVCKIMKKNEDMVT